METAIIITKKILANLTKNIIKEQTIKKFGKNVVFSILAILIMLFNTFDNFDLKISGLTVQKGYNYAKGLDSMEMVGRVDNVVGVERIRFGCPTDHKVLTTARFGYSAGYFNNSRPHNGWDSDVKYEDVKSVIDGVVISRGFDYMGGGWLLVVEGADGFRSWHAHLSDFYVGVGDRVSIGDVVAKSGNSGSATTAAHLHLTILKNLVPVDPLIYLRDCTL